MRALPDMADDLEFSGVALGPVVSQPVSLFLLSKQPHLERNCLEARLRFQHKSP